MHGAGRLRSHSSPDHSLLNNLFVQASCFPSRWTDTNRGKGKSPMCAREAIFTERVRSSCVHDCTACPGFRLNRFTVSSGSTSRRRFSLYSGELIADVTQMQPVEVCCSSLWRSVGAASRLVEHVRWLLSPPHWPVILCRQTLS